jgi:eukaryotic-like serine/threonine-protein kinase
MAGDPPIQEQPTRPAADLLPPTPSLAGNHADTATAGPPAPPAAGEHDPAGTVTGDPDHQRRRADRSALRRDGVAVPGYEVEGELGRGGMGVVYKARQAGLNRAVALKMVLGGAAADGKAVIRFLAEAEAVAAVKHTHVVQVYEYGESDGRPYMALEYCPGGSLADRLRGGARIGPRAAAELVRRVAAGVGAAHEAGIVHRDLKPANVLFDEAGEPKVADFGLAKRAAAELTHTGAIVGTPLYMSPEQAGGKTKFVGPPADVWALGVMLYECLAGARPFAAGTTDELLARLLTTEPDPLRGRVPGLPRDLDLICRKALEKDPARRYGSAGELAADLRAYLAGRPVAARPVGPAGRAWRWRKRNPALAAALAAAVFALVAGSAVSAGFGVWALASARAARDEAARADGEAVRANEEAARATTAANLAGDEADRATREKARADEKTEEVRGAAYAARQQVAMNAWRQNRLDVLAEVIARQAPAPGERDRRGFEAAYLERLALSPGRRWQTAGQMVNGVAIAPDSKTVFTVGFDGRGTAWDPQTGRKKWDTADRVRWSVNAAAVSPDGKTVAFAGHLGQLQLWNTDGTFRAKLEGHKAQVFGALFSPDGRFLASASADQSVRVWNAADGTPVGVLGEDIGAPGPGPKAIPQTNPTESVGHTNMVWQAAWSPDSTRVATCSTDGSIKVWAMPERRLLRTMVGHEGIVVAVAWSPDGKSVASVSRPLAGTGGGEVKLWNPDTGRVETTFRPPTGGLHAVTFTPDGLFVVTAGADRTVRVWRKDGREVAEHRGFRTEVIGVAVGGDGRWAVAGTRGGEIVAFDLDVTPGRRAVSLAFGAHRLATVGGRLADARGGAVHWRDPDTLAEAATWPAPKLPDEKRGTIDVEGGALAVRADGQAAHNAREYRVAGKVVWRDADGGVRHLLSGHTSTITALAFLPGDRLASADADGTLRVWNGSGVEVTNLSMWDGPVRFLVATADGGLWAGGALWAPGSKPGDYDRKTASAGRLVRVADGRAAQEIPLPAPPGAAALSPDGRTLVVGRDEGALQWLDADTGRGLRGTTSAAGATRSIAFSPTERRIAVGRADGVVRLLDADSGEELLALDGLPGSAAGLAFSADGRRLFAAVQGGFRDSKLVAWDGRAPGVPAPLSAPDTAWHKDRVAAASDRDEIRFGHRITDAFALRYHLTRLRALEPDEIKWPAALLGLAQDANDYNAAVRLLTEILKKWPDSAGMWYELGNAKRELGDVTGAEAAFRKSIEIDPKVPEVHCNLGLLLGRDGRFEEAAESLARGHELGTSGAKQGGKKWDYPSAFWLAQQRRLAAVAKKYADATDFSALPAADRRDLIEVLTLTRRPLAAVTLAGGKGAKSPGPVVIGAAIRCGEGLGDAAGLTAEERAGWRGKALDWIKEDFDRIRSGDPVQRARQAAGIRGHPMLLASQGDRTAGWPAAEREAWQTFWSEVDAASR